MSTMRSATTALLDEPSDETVELLGVDGGHGIEERHRGGTGQRPETPDEPLTGTAPPGAGGREQSLPFGEELGRLLGGGAGGPEGHALLPGKPSRLPGGAEDFVGDGGAGHGHRGHQGQTDPVTRDRAQHGDGESQGDERDEDDPDGRPESLTHRSAPRYGRAPGARPVRRRVPRRTRAGWRGRCDEGRTWPVRTPR